MNVTETCLGYLNLITNVMVEKANTPDTAFVEPAIQATLEVTGQPIEKAYVDGAFQSLSNEVFCQNIDIFYTGIRDAEPKYDLEITPQGLMVAETD